LARAVCDRHQGVGADGLIIVERSPAGARMSLYNPTAAARKFPAMEFAASVPGWP
jgi:hypothetical protein